MGAITLSRRPGESLVIGGTLVTIVAAGPTRVKIRCEGSLRVDRLEVAQKRAEGERKAEGGRRKGEGCRHELREVSPGRWHCPTCGRVGSMRDGTIVWESEIPDEVAA